MKSQPDELTQAIAKTLKRLGAPKMIEKIICGRRLSLRARRTYVAAVPLYQLRPKWDNPVTVSILYADPVLGVLSETSIGNFTQDGAREFLKTFNNGRVSFVGRKWTSK